MSKQSHIERTAHEPRDASLHTVTITAITQVTPTIRLLRLSTTTPIHFLPGQWLDVHPPPSAAVPKPGGFTIISSPSLAQQQPSFNPSPKPHGTSSPSPEDPYLELAIQSSPTNPAAAYLFLPPSQLLHTTLQVRVGGSFVFPPPFLSHRGGHGDEQSGRLKKVVLVAGGMGINPLISMLSYIGEQADGMGVEVRVLYATKDPGIGLGQGGGVDGGEEDGARILFLERMVGLFGSGRVKGGLRLFLTWGWEASRADMEAVRCRGGVEVPFLRQRITVADVEEAVGGGKEDAVVYVCGVPSMTDEFVDALVSPEGFGMDKRRVLFEKWW
ncbi:oxidoreductase NAD-binding domain-containing protein 1 [Staphylotrichum tortipilum]|uniref:Oxidoreductase NAD-binding domain-containing protein 1 n=1 Tax=Staphylotrichum tortipilum TaxID=2831512 RepID=A0AAN6MJ49_9PEZI|nr:oxidoreductase NAD-binding domain-containing protein 1 [Staphylotrichum longicolle]